MGFSSVEGFNTFLSNICYNCYVDSKVVNYEMVLEAEAKIFQSSKARTQYVMIPAAIVGDSQYPFRSGERVRIVVDPYRKMMIITSIEEPYIKVSREGIFIKGRWIEVVEK